MHTDLVNYRNRNEWFPLSLSFFFFFYLFIDILLTVFPCFCTDIILVVRLQTIIYFLRLISIEKNKIIKNIIIRAKKLQNFLTLSFLWFHNRNCFHKSYSSCLWRKLRISQYQCLKLEITYRKEEHNCLNWRRNCH